MQFGLKPLTADLGRAIPHHNSLYRLGLPEAKLLEGWRVRMVLIGAAGLSAMRLRRLFTSQSTAEVRSCRHPARSPNADHPALADILRALCTAAGRIQLKTETRNCSRDLGSLFSLPEIVGSKVAVAVGFTTKHARLPSNV
jgi:hypothetical protein